MIFVYYFVRLVEFARNLVRAMQYLLVILLIFNIHLIKCDSDSNCALDKSYDGIKKDAALKSLEKLKTFFGQDLDIKGDGYTYNLKICGDVPDVGPNNNLQYTTISKVDNVQNKVLSLGRRNRTLVSSGDNWIMLTFMEGDRYDNNTCNHEQRQSSVLFVCSKYKYVLDLLYIDEVKVSPNCHYIFEIQHHNLCQPEHPGLSSGSIFIIIVLVSFLCYFVFGFLYRRLVIGAQGVEQIPHREFWMKTGNMFANCCDMMCRCDRYCESNQSSFDPDGRNGYSPIGEQPIRGSSSIDSDAALINP